MAKKLLGPWNVAFPVRFRSGGDTTSQAFGKHIQEIERIYGLLNALDVAKIGNEELTELLINIQNLLANLKHNNLKEIQGGSATERYHLTSAQVSKLDNAPAGKDHNTNLTGHQGGSSTERYHLTAAQVSKLDNAPAGKDHNTNLTGLQGGSATERYHLTAAQVSKLNGAADSGDIIKNHNSLQNIQGGNSSERYHLTSAQVTKLDNAPAGKDHNTNLTGLQGGSSSERYHLTAAQVAKLNGAAGSGDIITQHNSLQGLQGGDSSNRYHLTKAQLDGLSNLITNPPKVFERTTLTQNGYALFDNGLLINWGVTSGISAAGDALAENVTFPMSFTGGPWAVLATPWVAQPNEDNDWWYQVSDVTVSGMKVWRMTSNRNTASLTRAHWIAIGKGK